MSYFSLHMHIHNEISKYGNSLYTHCLTQHMLRDSIICFLYINKNWTLCL
uniref:Uncharacterized protein n=1 Tax=Rhizophora mucronata TaxID=61149 RepID=A0A2P2NCK2_RHIMU